jgi:hypothetical protein
MLPPLALADMIAGLYGTTAVLVALREVVVPSLAECNNFARSSLLLTITFTAGELKHANLAASTAEATWRRVK